MTGSKPKRQVDEATGKLIVENLIPDIQRYLNKYYGIRAQEELQEVTQRVCLRLLQNNETNPYNPQRAAVSTYLYWVVKTTVSQYREELKKQQTHFVTEEPLDDGETNITMAAYEPTERDHFMQTVHEFRDFLKKQPACNKSDITENPVSYFDLMITGHSLREILLNGRVVHNQIRIAKDGTLTDFPSLKDEGVDVRYLNQMKNLISSAAKDFAAAGGV